ncbi:proline/glycine betaine ABC transporter permease [Ornithinimicrobium humiphilum]|uniref:Glycine betaine/proline transport system permease protein n=1 Tax=Ornithinimicrobium humiphilum TaxID=125288 RepID=A0A543K7I6_9MICO|nr:ABC transporter permease subunit [Ornithinimicrobium humiphilum]TQM91051.1 glycine betaine/proline transport system permease protein [Ornithinimicrobium humiphilum]
MSSTDALLPRIPVGTWVDTAFDWVDDNLGVLLDLFRDVMTVVVEGLVDLLMWPPPLVLVAVLALLAWVVASWRLAVGTALGLALVVSMGIWLPAMQTLALVAVATVVAVAIAIPVGVLAARNDAVSAVVRPVLDLMQTMPGFVYLIPAVTFFSIGLVPGIFATIIFALPPGVRLTELGIRQVDRETVEAGESFGASPWQILRGVQLPLAVPTIMAGVNQVIMLALSMAVIAGFTGADGLGKLVVESIARLNTPLGVEAGLGVVILAIYLDRVTAALGDPGRHPRSLLALARARRAAATPAPTTTTAPAATPR